MNKEETNELIGILFGPTYKKENEDLKKRINKAIDYIKIEFCQINEETKELECWHKRVEPILDILNGKEYKEEE